MTGLLTTERIASASQFLEHVSIANSGGTHLDSRFAHGDVQTEVAHDGRDQHVVDESAAGMQCGGQNGHDRVAVDQLSGRVDCEASVGVAVERDAEVGAVFQNGRLQLLHVRRAAVGVDVDAVGFGVDGGDGGTSTGEHLRTHLCRSTIRAVDDDVESVESRVDGRGEMRRVAGTGVGCLA